MCLAPQEHLAESYEARDMKDRPWGKVMELDPVECQKPSQEWVDGKSEPSQEERDEAHVLSLLWMGEVLRKDHAVE
jgi:hypothetical protein